MFPEFLGINRDNYGRVAGIVSGLENLAVDVVMLQEVWDSAPFAAFTGNLSSTLPYIAAVTPATLPPNRSLTSGLWFGSRYPILSQDFRIYLNAGPSEELASKGVYGALLNVSGTLVLAFNTHLYSPETTTTGSVRALQLQEARQFIDSMLNQSQFYGAVSHILWGGDFNTAESSSAEYQTLLSTANAFDLFREAYPSDPGNTYSSWNPAQRIDYIFALDWNTSFTVNNASVQCFAGYVAPANSSTYNPCLQLAAQSCCEACEAASDATHTCGWCEGTGANSVNLCLDSALLNSFCATSGVAKDNCSAPAPAPDCQELYLDCGSCTGAVSNRTPGASCVWCGGEGTSGICLTNLPYSSIICNMGVNGSLYGTPFNTTCPTGALPSPVGAECPNPSGVTASVSGNGNGTDSSLFPNTTATVGRTNSNAGNSNEFSNSSSLSEEESKCGGLAHCGLWALVALGILFFILMLVALVVARIIQRKSPSNTTDPEGSSSSDYDEE
jgi:endonuclease/exonuclease/phosphatase family metal-dependent hydrolase